MVSNSEPKEPTAASRWQANQVYALAVISLLVGLAIGYLLPGGQATIVPRPAPVSGAKSAVHPMPTLDQMKQLADAKAAPLLEKLKTSPNDAVLLAQIGALYNSSHQFKQAAEYYRQSLKIDPRNAVNRTELASCLYYGGDADGALRELQLVLKSDPKNANALFNLGMIKWKGKNDPPAAIAAWQELLRTNPNLDRKPIVEQMIAEAKGQIGAGK